VVFAIDVHNMNIDEYLNYVNPPAVHKFQDEHGDSILCVLYADQISLRGSEERSAETRNEQKTKVAQNFSAKTGCPEGTVPILETKRENVERKGSVTGFLNSERKIMTRSAKNLKAEKVSSASVAHQYALLTVDKEGPFLQVSAQLNVWNPKLINGSGIFSATYIGARNQEGNIIENVLAGWEVHPAFYGDTKTRFFVRWTRLDSKNPSSTKGCENTLCPGFVLAPAATNHLGTVISPLSTYDGDQRKIDVELRIENPGPRWSVYLNEELLGWWPGTMFTTPIYYKASLIELGGEVMFYVQDPEEPSSKTEMGSGNFPSAGYARCAHIRKIQISNEEGVMEDFDTNRMAPKPVCYDVSDVSESDAMGAYFYFGGPGGEHFDCVS